MRMEPGRDAIELPAIALRQCVGVNRKAASAAEPAVAFEHGGRLRRSHAGRGNFRPTRLIAPVGRMINLTHASIEAGDHPGRTGFLRQRSQCADRNHGQSALQRPAPAPRRKRFSVR